MDPFSHLLLAEETLPLVLAPILFVGFRRARRLQAYLPDPRLESLARFFALYGVAVLLRVGLEVALLLEALPGASRLPPQRLMEGDLPLAGLAVLWAHHALVVAAFAGVAWQYARRPGASVAAIAGIGAWAAATAQILEAALALVPALATARNSWGRHTRRSLHVASGFGLLALGHLGLAGLLATTTLHGSFHLILLTQLLALGGALALVFSLPRGTP